MAVAVEDDILDKMVAFEQAEYCGPEGWEQLAGKSFNICVAFN